MRKFWLEEFTRYGECVECISTPKSIILLLFILFFFEKKNLKNNIIPIIISFIPHGLTKTIRKRFLFIFCLLILFEKKYYYFVSHGGEKLYFACRFGHI